MRILDAFVKAGSHYLTRAEWGCLDGDHRSWIIVEALNDADAKGMVPPVIRPNAKVIRLFEFTAEHVKLVHELGPEQFRQLRKLDDEQLLQFQTGSLEEIREVARRLLDKESSTSG